jgi:hypothetical protein
MGNVFFGALLSVYNSGWIRNPKLPKRKFEAASCCATCPPFKGKFDGRFSMEKLNGLVNGSTEVSHGKKLGRARKYLKGTA